MEIKKYKTRFSLISSGKNSEEKQIFLVATIEGIEVFYYSGYRVSPPNFIKKSKENYIEQIKKNTFNKDGDSSSTINARIRELENASLKVFEQSFKGRDIEFDKDEFKKLLQIALGEYALPISNDEDATTNLITLHSKYIEFLKAKGTYHRHHQADNNKLTKYSAHIKEALDLNTIDILRYTKFLSKSLSNNSLVTNMKRVRTFFSWLKANKYINNSPFDEIKFSENIGTEAYDEPICMTREELTQLYLHKPKTEHKMLVKDMFCLQAALGCRVGDYTRLKYSNIQNGQLIYYPSKTSEYAGKVVVPISKRAKEIIDKYRGHEKGELIMPFMNSVEYNETIKEVFKDAELNRMIIQYDREKKKEAFSPLHKLATSHLARRTFVDILCQAGEPIHVVASMSGHSENSKAFDRYRRRPEQLQKEAVKRSMD